MCGEELLENRLKIFSRYMEKGFFFLIIKKGENS
jgi:hypothetical protein